MRKTRQSKGVIRLERKPSGTSRKDILDLFYPSRPLLSLGGSVLDINVVIGFRVSRM